MTETELPQAMVPLFHAFLAATFSLSGKRMPWHEIKVTVSAIDMEKALKWSAIKGQLSTVDGVERLRTALAEIADLTHRQQLPITSQVHQIAIGVLYPIRNGDGG